jgi:hypothetical protein
MHKGAIPDATKRIRREGRFYVVTALGGFIVERTPRRDFALLRYAMTMPVSRSDGLVARAIAIAQDRAIRGEGVKS